MAYIFLAEKTESLHSGIHYVKFGAQANGLTVLLTESVK